MENAVISIIFMAIVGAAIGGVTNYLAIKMLFRPHNAIYIKSWRVPLTPGLIPKRRSELANQIGNIVTKHLLTPEVFRNRFFSEDIKKSILSYAQKKTEELIFTNNKTILDWAKMAGFTNLPETIEGKVDNVIDKQIVTIKNTLSSKSIEQLLPDELQQLVNKKIPEMVTYLLKKSEEYFLSAKGEMTIGNMLDDFLSSKGSLGGMIQMVLGDSNALVGKIQRELLKFLNSPGTKDLLVTIFTKEWDKLKQQSITNYVNEVHLDSMVSNVKSYAKNELAITERLEKPISYYWPQGNEWTKNDLLPKMIDKGFVAAESKLEDVLTRLNLQEVVREQVDSFPLQKLEEIVIGIANRELKMITILGAVLGGVIGIVQGLIVHLLN